MFELDFEKELFRKHFGWLGTRKPFILGSCAFDFFIFGVVPLCVTGLINNGLNKYDPANVALAVTWVCYVVSWFFMGKYPLSLWSERLKIFYPAYIANTLYWGVMVGFFHYDLKYDHTPAFIIIFSFLVTGIFCWVRTYQTVTRIHEFLMALMGRVVTRELD